MLGGFSKPEQPGDHPKKPKPARHQKCGTPAEVQRKNGNRQRSDNDAHVGTAVEYSRRERPFLLGKPVGDGSNGSGKIRCLARTKCEARHAERPETGSQGMGSRCKTPHDDSNRVSEAFTDAVDDP